MIQHLDPARRSSFSRGIPGRSGTRDGRFHRECGTTDTDREISAGFDRQASATNSVSFPCLFPPKARKTVSFFVSF
jgi:hypothetical protein